MWCIDGTSIDILWNFLNRASGLSRLVVCSALYSIQRIEQNSNAKYWLLLYLFAYCCIIRIFSCCFVAFL